MNLKLYDKMNAKKLIKVEQWEELWGKNYTKLQLDKSYNNSCRKLHKKERMFTIFASY